jgi:hypothetical protein
VNDSQRARSGSDGVWVRARGAYVALLGDEDPAAAALATGAVDLRPGHSDEVPDSAAATLVSGPDDLAELREIVESATGVGTWPRSSATDGEIITVELRLERPAALLGLLLAMEGVIERRSPWGRWRTMVDTMAARVQELDVVTIDNRLRKSLDD